MPQTLLEITDDLMALDDLLTECGGDVSDPAVAEAIDRWMAELGTGFEKKVDNYAALIVSLERRSDVRKGEAQRLQLRARIDANAAEFLANRLKAVLVSLGKKKVETDRYTVSIVTSGGVQSLDVFDPDAVPEQFKVTPPPPPPKINTDAIRVALNAGQEVPGARYLPRTQNLRIK